MIYIHIPFCKSICSYCDFYHSASLVQLDAITESILVELDRRRDYISGPIKTIYFGGGTPSVLPLNAVSKILDKISTLWALDLVEVTFEANPEDISYEYAVGLRSLGINRLSMGIQSFNDSHLVKFNRRHNSAGALTAFNNARRACFDNISIDLIYGMSFMTLDQWHSNLQQAIALSPEHISAYHLTIEEKTLLWKQGLEAVGDDISQIHYDILCNSMRNGGYDHYEISNFSKPNRRSLHNSSYWNNTPYLGVGPSAHSYNLESRHWNVSSNRQYLSGSVGESEILSDIDHYNEHLMTSLRTSNGFVSPSDSLLSKASRFLSSGDLVYDDGVLLIPENKWLISDYLISSLFE